MKTNENNSKLLNIYLSKLDDYIYSDEYIEKLHNKVKGKFMFINGEFNEKTHHFFIKKILKYIDFFLSTGPLTKNEHKLFISAVELMKEYYLDQMNKTTQEDIFFPDPSTPGYALFFTDKLNPIKSVLQINEEKEE
ncbi:hypothetical protein EHP00_966 [Ecytonucleospora hepatopenaei]|uniref:Uncharacterized protein n=1 Tax=Ecytonucleospora hepatopenaei TaxID=646526 RepID=A0A1W0E6Y1_9MICR|nr:hypothetical protein EHP00_966 [Ecytonucleospora hepatopenaei]